VLDVLDRGPGIPRNLRGMIGHEPVSQKLGVQGLGLGLYLATGTIQRLGGTLELSDREGGGTRARMTLPLNTLLVNDGDDREHGHAIIAAG
jgi:two-component system sensor histidine kinase RegB